MKKSAQHVIAEALRRHSRTETKFGIDWGDVWSQQQKKQRKEEKPKTDLDPAHEKERAWRTAQPLRYDSLNG